MLGAIFICPRGRCLPGILEASFTTSSIDIFSKSSSRTSSIMNLEKKIKVETNFEQFKLRNYISFQTGAKHSQMTWVWNFQVGTVFFLLLLGLLSLAVLQTLILTKGSDSLSAKFTPKKKRNDMRHKNHVVWKSKKKSHSTLLTFWMDKSKLKMPKIVHFGEFLQIWSLRSNSVTRQVSFNRTNIGGKRQNSKIQMRHFE